MWRGGLQAPPEAQHNERGKKRMEKVIFRRYKDEFFGTEAVFAMFPQTPANPGRYAGVSMVFCDDGKPTPVKCKFEPFCEVSREWYYNDTRLIRKEDTGALLEALEERYEERFLVAERVTRKDDEMRRF